MKREAKSYGRKLVRIAHEQESSLIRKLAS